jgi:hypothetical protein
MAALPVNNYSAPGNAFWLSASAPAPSFSTITLNTLTVRPNANSVFGVAGIGSNGIGLGATTTTSANNILTMGSGPNVAASGFVAGQPAYAIEYGQSNTTKAQIQMAPSFAGQGPSGGVQLTGQNNEQFIVANSATTSVLGAQELSTYFTSPSTIRMQHYLSNVQDSEILFDTNNKAIQLIASLGSGNTNSIAVGVGGIVLNPGSNQPVSVASGYVDLTNKPMSNVSSINGFQFNAPNYALNAWVNPGAPSNITTPASSSAVQPIVPFNTISGHTYMLCAEYGSSNVGGGGATDTTALLIQTNGKGYFIDSWITDQTYATRYASATGFFIANDSNTTLSVTNETAGGNQQAISILGMWTKDMGVQVNQY